MVYSAFYCDENQLSILNDLGCAGNLIVNLGLKLINRLL